MSHQFVSSKIPPISVKHLVELTREHPDNAIWICIPLPNGEHTFAPLNRVTIINKIIVLSPETPEDSPS